MGEPILRIKTEDEVMLVEQKYWERFLKTGKIVDYLSYKNLTAGQGTAGRHGRGVLRVLFYGSGSLLRQRRE